MTPTRSRSISPVFSGRLLLVGTLALLLSGCTMRALIGVNVNADGSGIFEVSMAFDEELRTLLEQESEEPIDWSDPQSFEGDDNPADLLGELPEGAAINPYSEGDFEGFTVSMDFSSLEELNRLLEESASEGEEAFPFEVTEPEEGRFELATHGDVFGETESMDDEMVPESMLSDLFDMRLQVQLPGEVITTNADETTDEGVMVWQLDPMAEDQARPEAVSEVSSSSALPIIILIGILVVGAGVAAVLFLRRGSRSPEAAPVDPADATGSEGLPG